MLRIRKVSSDKVFLHEKSQIKFKTAGNTREVQFSAGVNNKCPIQNISKDIYMDKVTNKIKKGSTAKTAISRLRVSEKAYIQADGFDKMQCHQFRILQVDYSDLCRVHD